MNRKALIIAGLAGLGALGAGMLLTRNNTGFRWWLAAVNPADWKPLFPRLGELWRAGFTGIDVRIVNPDTASSQAERDLAKAVRDSGGLVRVHGWQGVRRPDGYAGITPELAKRQARALIARARELSAPENPVRLASGNFERDWWRWPGAAGGYTANPDGVRSLNAWLDIFALEAPPELYPGDLGFSNPAEHYQPSDHDQDGQPDARIPRATLERFARRGIMAYGDTPTSVIPRLERARAATPPSVPLSWWHSVGRLDPTTGQVGRAATLTAGWAARWGRIDEAVSYVGYGAIGQVFTGHQSHPALIDLVRAARGAA